MLDLRQLQALAAVAEQGSVTRAAKTLGWSQPSVDHHLHKLDRMVGSPVLHRSTRGSQLTEEGRVLLTRGTEILNLADSALEEVRRMARNSRARLRLGLVPTVAARFLPTIAHALTDNGVEPQAVLEENPVLLQRVQDRELDAAIVYRVPGYPLPLEADMRVQRLYSDPLMMALPEGHPAASGPSIDRQTLRELRSESWVFGTTDTDPLDDVVRDAFPDEEGRIRSVIRTEDYSVLLGVVAAELSVGLLSSLWVDVGKVPPGVVLLPFDDPRFVREIVLVTSQRPPDSVGLVRSAVVDSFK